MERGTRLRLAGRSGREFYVRVAQSDKDGCLYIASYIGGGEGDLVSLRVYDVAPLIHDKGRGIKIPELARVDHKIGHEMWWHQGKEDAHHIWGPEGA